MTDPRTMREPSVDPLEMRRINTARALEIIDSTGPTTITQLIVDTGLSRKTVERIVDDLIGAGWVCSGPPASTRHNRGRPARVLTFAASRLRVLAVDLQFEATVIEVVDADGTAKARIVAPSDADASRETRMETIREGLNAALHESGVEPSHILATGIATPGIVRASGEIDLGFPPPFWHPSAPSLATALNDLFPGTVIIENDAKLAALAELGSNANEDFFLLRTDGKGTGLGIVIGGRVYRGRDGAAGEIFASERLDFDGFDHAPFSRLISPGSRDQKHKMDPDAADIVQRAEDGDVDALAHIHELATVLAPTVRAIARILAPDRILLGGPIASGGRPLLDAIAFLLREGEHPVTAPVAFAAFGDRGSVHGAAIRAVEHVKSGLYRTRELLPG